MTKDQKTFNDVPIPVGVDSKMVTVAKDYVTSRLKDGFTMGELFQRHSMSSKTFYQWKNDIPEYEAYINQLSDVLVDENELEQVRKMKKKILAFADKSSPSSAEMKMFMETFSYLFEADARLQMDKLGLNKVSDSGNSEKTLEEKKNSLLARLTAKQ